MIQLRPDELLDAWDGWGASLKLDLVRLTEPIDLMPLVDEAISCIERVMVVIIHQGVDGYQAMARAVIDAVECLPVDALKSGALPVLLEITADGSSVEIRHRDVSIRASFRRSAHARSLDCGRPVSQACSAV